MDNIDRAIASLKLLEKYPFLSAVGKAFPNIKEIRVEPNSPNTVMLCILFKDDSRLNPTGFYEGMPDADAVELVQTSIDEDLAFKDFQRRRDDLYKALKDDEIRLAHEYHEKVDQLNKQVADIKQRRHKKRG